MTPTRVKAAIVAMLTTAKPDPAITVSDAQTFDDATLPRISVGLSSVEPHSATLPGAYKLGVEIKLHAHAKDAAARAQVDGWCDLIEQTINDAELVKSVLAALGRQIRVDHWLASSGAEEWDEAVLVVTWEAECWAVRAG